MFIRFLKQEFKKRKKAIAIIGISGGIDSAVVAFLCKKAGLDIYALLLPYGQRKASKEQIKILKSLTIAPQKTFLINIKPSVDATIKELNKAIKADQITKGNIMARQRMIIEYALAKSLNGLVVGTENLSEYYLGYFTLHGDQACDLNPIGDLLKTEVKELARFLGVPEEIIDQTPTAGLWQGQTDEKELGFTYAEADRVIYLSLFRKYPTKKIQKQTGLKMATINKILKRIKDTEYKRQAPPKCNLR